MFPLFRMPSTRPISHRIQSIATLPTAIVNKVRQHNSQSPSIRLWQIHWIIWSLSVTVVIVSRLVYRKGVDLMAGVISKLVNMKNVNFLIGGDGPKRSLLEEIREKNNMQDRVTLLGPLEHSKVSRYATIAACSNDKMLTNRIDDYIGARSVAQRPHIFEHLVDRSLLHGHCGSGLLWSTGGVYACRWYTRSASFQFNHTHRCQHRCTLYRPHDSHRNYFASATSCHRFRIEWALPCQADASHLP